MELNEALAIVKLHGYRCTKPKPKANKRKGPTFVAEFADGQVTRMTTFAALDRDGLPGRDAYEHGVRLSFAAYEARNRNWFALLQLTAADMPAIVAACFEQDGEVIVSWDSLQAERRVA